MCVHSNGTGSSHTLKRPTNRGEDQDMDELDKALLEGIVNTDTDPEFDLTDSQKQLVADELNIPKNALESFFDMYAKTNVEMTDKLKKVINALKDALGELWDESKEDTPQKKRSNAHQKAIESGALITLDGHVASPTKAYRAAFTGYSIMRIPDTAQKKIGIISKSGELNTLLLQPSELEPLDKLQTAFECAMFEMVLKTDSNTNDEVSFQVTPIFRELGIDPRGYSAKRDKAGEPDGQQLSLADQRVTMLVHMVNPWASCVGKLPDGSYYATMSFKKYDPESDTATISLPYFFRMKEKFDELSGKVKPVHRLLHPDVTNESNWAAVELANRIIQGIVERGTTRYTYKTKPKKMTRYTTDKKTGKKITEVIEYENDKPQQDPNEKPPITYAVRYSTLIEDCPQLKRAIEDARRTGNAEKALLEAAPEGEDPDPQALETARKKDRATAANRVNNVLRDAFLGAYRIILEKSDVPARYKDFSIATVTRGRGQHYVTVYDTPTSSTLNRKLIITHQGLNREATEG